MSRALPVGISLQIHTSYYGLIPRVRLYPRLRFAAELEMDATRALAEVLPPASLKELGLTNQRPVFDSPADCCHSTRRTYASGGWLAASHASELGALTEKRSAPGKGATPGAVQLLDPARRKGCETPHGSCAPPRQAAKRKEAALRRGEMLKESPASPDGTRKLQGEIRPAIDLGSSPRRTAS
jgi:hypothetical protein